MKEKEIRPKNIFNRYLNLAKKDCYEIVFEKCNIKQNAHKVGRISSFLDVI